MPDITAVSSTNIADTNISNGDTANAGSTGYQRVGGFFADLDPLTHLGRYRTFVPVSYVADPPPDTSGSGDVVSVSGGADNGVITADNGADILFGEETGSSPIFNNLSDEESVLFFNFQTDDGNFSGYYFLPGDKAGQPITVGFETPGGDYTGTISLDDSGAEQVGSIEPLPPVNREGGAGLAGSGVQAELDSLTQLAATPGNGSEVVASRLSRAGANSEAQGELTSLNEHASTTGSDREEVASRLSLSGARADAGEQLDSLREIALQTGSGQERATSQPAPAGAVSELREQLNVVGEQVSIPDNGREHLALRLLGSSLRNTGPETFANLQDLLSEAGRVGHNC